MLPPTPSVFPAARHVVYPVHVCVRDPGSFSVRHGGSYPDPFAALFAGLLRLSPFSIVSFTGTGSHE